MKWDDGAGPPALFEAEAQGLAMLAATETVRLPAVIDVGATWILLEWLEPGAADPSTWPRLGHELAALHSYRSRALRLPPMFW